MRYDAESGKINITVGEFATVARRRICATSPYGENEPAFGGVSLAMLRSLGLGKETPLAFEFLAGGYSYLLTGGAIITEDGGIAIPYAVNTPLSKIPKEDRRLARGEAFILGKMLKESAGRDSVTLKVIYVSESSGEWREECETVSGESLDLFFDRCAMAISVYGRPEAERVTKRLPSMRASRFPYERVRDGQSELVRSVYRAIARGTSLFACAPTGTGKTVSALYPAVRALGEGKCEKVFYLTPKTTTAEAAVDCLSLLAEEGAVIRGVRLAAKERCCIGGGRCKEDRRLCENSPCKKLPEAVMDLYDREKTVIGHIDIIECAKKHSVCPHELELTYAELCDVVIGDINYLFDPGAHIRRFFDEGGEYAFLIDEAHNLSDRAREMYSAALTDADLVELAADERLGALSALRQTAKDAALKMRSIILPYLKDEMRRDRDGGEVGAVHLSDVPSPLYSLFSQLETVADEELRTNLMAKDEERSIRINVINDFLIKIRQVNLALSLFDSGYKLFLFLEGGVYRMKLFCLDTGRVIRSATGKGRSAVFFSATLSPLDYYREVLGGDGSSELLEVRSPFDPDQLSVSIMDKISTRYSERDRTLGAVCRVIAATLSARRGHYMVFSPSFEYSEALARAFSAKYPKISVLSQKKDMTQGEKAEFLRRFNDTAPGYLVGFCVMGGIYSEGVDLAGDSLIGAVVVSIGMPSLSYEREALTEYYEERFEMGKQYAYIYPGMNRVLQAAGRVIRREDDRGVIVLVDDRFDDPIYKKSIPDLWRGMKYVPDAESLKSRLDRFWDDDKK